MRLCIICIKQSIYGGKPQEDNQEFGIYVHQNGVHNGDFAVHFKGSTGDSGRDRLRYLYSCGGNCFNIHSTVGKLVRSCAEIFEYCVEKINSITYLILNSNVNNTTKYIVNFSFKDNIKASIVLEYLSKKEIYVSTTSACNSKGEKMSYVIYSIYKDELRARNMLRLSFDETNTKEEIDAVFNEIDKCVKGTLWKI